MHAAGECGTAGGQEADAATDTATAAAACRSTGMTLQLAGVEYVQRLVGQHWRRWDEIDGRYALLLALTAAEDVRRLEQ